jgi:hypothetical protein
MQAHVTYEALDTALNKGPAAAALHFYLEPHPEPHFNAISAITAAIRYFIY